MILSGGNRLLRHYHQWTPMDNDITTIKRCPCGAIRKWKGIRWVAIAPKCKCGKTCAYYGLQGGYSKACIDCNAKKALQSKESRARVKARNEQ